MKIIKSRTCKLNVAVLVVSGIVTLDLILAVGVGAASDPTFTTIDSQEATYFRSTATFERRRTDDGAGLTGTGILVLGTAAQPVTDVEGSGFEVRDFQRGIVLQFTEGSCGGRS